MIYLDGIGLSFLIKETKENILRYKLTKIYQYDKSSFSFYFGKKNLLFQVKDNSTVFYVKDGKDLNTDYQSKFLLTLKKYLVNSILMDIRQENYDRIVYFDFEKLNQFGDIEKYRLVMEIMGRASNVFLLNEEGKILVSLYFVGLEVGNRVTMAGANYTLPFEERKMSPEDLKKEDFPFDKEKFVAEIEGVGNALAEECKSDFTKFREYLESYKPLIYEIQKESKTQKIISYNEFSSFGERATGYKEYGSITEAFNRYFESTITSNVINEKKKQLLRYIENQINKNKKIIKNIQSDIEKNKNYSKFKNIGDILAANMHNIKYGMDRISVYDFYDLKNIEIVLDPLKSPKDNLAHYYNRYNKGKRTLLALENRWVEVEENLKYFEDIKYFIENEKDFVGIEEIEDELNLTSNNKTKIKLNRNKKREFYTEEFNGHKIFVGRNNKENDEISFKKAKDGDIWLHVRDIPGSHVLIIKNNREVDEETINYAAKLAAKNSKAKVGDKVSVDYCEKRFVKKIKGGKLGKVTYNNYKSLNIIVE